MKTGSEVVLNGIHYTVVGFINEPSVILEDKSLGRRMSVAVTSELWKSRVVNESLSFDEAVEKVIASANFANAGAILMIRATLKALTANGDVLIKSQRI